MRLASRSECQEIDRRSQSEYAIPADTLMEAAGTAAFMSLRQSFAKEVSRARNGTASVTVVCGPGNNGGDGLVVAKLLHSAGIEGVQVITVGPYEKRSPLFELQLARCEKIGIPVFEFPSTEASEALRRAVLIVDAIFGVGIRGEVLDPYRSLITAINRAQAPVVSLDTPSGLDVDRGVKCGVAVKADLTLTFGVAKRGFYVADGPSLTGRVKVLPIGFPLKLVREIASKTKLFTESAARQLLPRRKSRTHKSNYGHSLIIAGSAGMWGAGILAANAAYRVGSGYVTFASHEDLKAVIAREPEILTANVHDEGLWSAPRWTAAAIGPGLGVSAQTEELLKRLVASGCPNVVVDADAITVAARSEMFPLPHTWILTPHAGELSRILGISAQEIEADRFLAAAEASERTGCIVLLKGFRTIVAKGSYAWVIDSGNSALAKAGTGDVLTGMIVGLLAQGLKPMQAAATAAYVHGRLADEWVRSGRSQSSLVAKDLYERLPGLLAELTGEKRQ